MVFAAVCMLLSSCQQRIDGSSEEALSKSLARISKSLNAEKEKKFRDAMLNIMAIGPEGTSAKYKGSKQFIESFLKRVDGKTVDEIIAAGELLVAAQKKSRQNDETADYSGVMFNLKGTASNVQAKQSSGVTMQIKKTGTNNYSCKGNFDNVNLFGSFAMTGSGFADAYNPNLSTVTFSGTFMVGGADGSGFPQGTEASISAIINLTENNATGSYKIQEIKTPLGTTPAQDGLLTLDAQSK